MSSELYENSVQRHVPLYATISANGDKTCDILLSDPGTNCTGKRGNLCSQSFRSILGRPLMKPHVLWRLSSDHRTATRMPYRAAHKMRGEGVLFAMFHSAPLYRLMGIKSSDTLKKTRTSVSFRQRMERTCGFTDGGCGAEVSIYPQRTHRNVEKLKAVLRTFMDSYSVRAMHLQRE